MKRVIFCVVLISCFIAYDKTGASPDPWQAMRKQYENKNTAGRPAVIKTVETDDPWMRLRNIFLPFTLEEEKQAQSYPEKSAPFAQKFNQPLEQYDTLISRASSRFGIPKALIKAVIMAESGGNKFAAAEKSSAKGLMQTIDSTFAMARQGLGKMSIRINDDPFDPESSIMAGTWYLDRMYQRCVREGRIMKEKKDDISTWRYPLEYYYAGPANGAKKENKIYVFSNGEKREIDKRAYSHKIQKWAAILAT